MRQPLSGPNIPSLWLRHQRDDEATAVWSTPVSLCPLEHLATVGVHELYDAVLTELRRDLHAKGRGGETAERAAGRPRGKAVNRQWKGKEKAVKRAAEGQGKVHGRAAKGTR